jgi:glyoxylase-like metal-dependent hydrolase (beta-lactamase superfamily II)
MTENYVSIGDFRCFPLTDGNNLYPTGAIFPGRSEAELADAFAPQPVQPGITVGYSGLLVDTGRQRILIDTGAGAFGPNTGRLPDNVAASGFTPDQIDLIILSHLHPDHIGGLMTAEGEFRFPNAEVVLSQTEHDFWMSEGNQAKMKSMTLMGMGELEHFMLSSLQKNIAPLAAAGRLRMTEADCELQPGIQVLPAFGHTPGHVAVLIFGGRQQLLFGGDAILHPAHVRYPEWTTAFDILPDQTVLTRRRILDRSASDRYLTFHFHFPFPCLGSVSRVDSGYRWEPVEL